MVEKTEVIAKLRKELLQWQGIKSAGEFSCVNLPAAISESFPDKVFPVGAIHEFISEDEESFAATAGFVNTLLQGLMANGGPCVWVTAGQALFPPALKAFGVSADRVLFIQVKSQRDAFWITEECLKCDKLAAVISDVRELNFVQSRKLQLAVESSRVTGFIMRHKPKSQVTTACIARWRITPLLSRCDDVMPGLGFVSWRVMLDRVRNGSPGSWDVVYRQGGIVLKDSVQQVIHGTDVLKKIRVA